MFEKFSRSWELVKASAAVLRADKELMLFPIISAAATLVVLATFLIPAFGWRVFETGSTFSTAIWIFLFYFCQYTVIIFFNSALVGAALMRLEGEEPTLRAGLELAWSRVGAILGYAGIAATVGVVLQAMKKDDSILMRLLGSGLGVAWTLATFMVVPVLVTRETGPVEALKTSAGMLRYTWGENVIGQAGISTVFGLFMLIAIVVGGLLTYVAAQLSIVLAVLIGGVFVIGVLLLGVYQSALNGVYSAALYRFASVGEAPAGFGNGMLEGAFAAKQ